MCKVSQAGSFTGRSFNNEGVKDKAIGKNITNGNKISSFSRLGKILKSVFNINIFLKGRKSNKDNAAAQVITINRISVNEASCLRQSLTRVNVKKFNGNEKSPASKPCAEDFFRSSKKVPGKLPPPPPPLSNDKNGIATDRVQSGDTTPPASLSMQPASQPTQPAQPLATSSMSPVPPPASPLTQPAQPLATSSMSPVPPPASSSAQFAPPPPPLPAQDFLKPNNALRINPLNGTGKSRGVMQKEPGSNEQEIKPGAFLTILM